MDGAGSSAHKDGYERATDNDEKKAKKNKCSDYLKRFDQLIVRPILIHKYEKDRNARAQEFYEMFQDEGVDVRRLYMRQRTKATRKNEAGESVTGSDPFRSEMLSAANSQMKRRASTRMSATLPTTGSGRGSN